MLGFFLIVNQQRRLNFFFGNNNYIFKFIEALRTKLTKRYFFYNRCVVLSRSGNIQKYVSIEMKSYSWHMNMTSESLLCATNK